MGGRVLLAVSCFALGGVLTACGTKYLFPPVVSCPSPSESPAAPVVAPAPTDEVVIEIRVKAPAGKAAGDVFAKDSSGLGQGALVNTQKPLDLAIEGDGFFQVTLPNGELAYTRTGNFGVGSQGALVTAQGYVVSPQITIPAHAVSISVGTDGTVSVQHLGALNASTVVGQLELCRFQNPGWLARKGAGLFQESERSGCPHIGTPGQNGLGLVRQGFRERHSDHNAAALLELVRDLGHETNNNADGHGVTVKLLDKGR